VEETWYTAIQGAPMFKVFKKLQLLEPALQKFTGEKFGDEQVLRKAKQKLKSMTHNIRTKAIA